MYEKWNQSSSDGFSSQAEMTDDQDHFTGDSNSDREFSTRTDEESDDDNDPIGVFETSGEKDILRYESDFLVELSFQRLKKPYFSILGVRIKPVGNRQVNVLQDLLYDKVVDLTYHLHGIGKPILLTLTVFNHSKKNQGHSVSVYLLL
jgi:hypothetical protein